jgi:hypothetical protein
VKFKEGRKQDLASYTFYCGGVGWIVTDLVGAARLGVMLYSRIAIRVQL